MPFYQIVCEGASLVCPLLRSLPSSESLLALSQSLSSERREPPHFHSELYHMNSPCILFAQSPSRIQLTLKNDACPCIVALALASMVSQDLVQPLPRPHPLPSFASGTRALLLQEISYRRFLILLSLPVVGNDASVASLELVFWVLAFHTVKERSYDEEGGCLACILWKE